MDERRTVRQVLLRCLKPTPESIFGELIDLDVNEMISLAKDGIEWKRVGPRNVASPTWRINAERITLQGMLMRKYSENQGSLPLAPQVLPSLRYQQYVPRAPRIVSFVPRIPGALPQSKSIG